MAAEGSITHCIGLLRQGDADAMRVITPSKLSSFTALATLPPLLLPALLAL